MADNILMNNRSPQHVQALIVSSSRYLHNYRHTANALLVYDLLTSLFVDDSSILLLDATNIIHAPRNPQRGKIFAEHKVLTEPEVDYRGDRVNTELFRDLLTLNPQLFREKYGQNAPFLADTEGKVLFLYMTGHGGDEFFKFHDNEELDALEFAQILTISSQINKFTEIVVIIDTCQAASMANYMSNMINTTFIGSSRLGENSYAFNVNTSLGFATVDRFTFAMHAFISQHVINRSYSGSKNRHKLSFQDLYDSFNPSFLYSQPVFLQFNSHKSLREMKLIHYFGYNAHKMKEYSNEKRARQAEVYDRLVFDDDLWVDQPLEDASLYNDTLIVDFIDSIHQEKENALRKMNSLKNSRILIKDVGRANNVNEVEFFTGWVYDLIIHVAMVWILYIALKILK